ncbi:O-acetyl-ADP-ribose deacetylase (regulator of RNase III), contains Macro domain [Atopostipes suicloacalis DSM 15692]|uniref:O-acetyl-ADP-ribose deacetylase (Regulator of RNase III), contains Macro domain n=1 Tax=Atopostipes suicloacalis DSM 15692 TaxID=1121025 RepID=A0A1M4YW42_9LACT|nr:O-acetyl-ADP-ribose deacetylase [Atopostipes suicloacalis]SHF10013.1 O-acetyl-ADP-ribose deacetylase (regulator of RNase III), contains Macro domain [Atopostipes suicloacalis DSM 15692]
MDKKMRIWQGDITTLKVDAIVNAANKSLLGGGGVDGAIHKAAGPELLQATKKLGGAETGEAKITKGYKLPAHFVIHTVGPVYKDGKSGEAQLLEDCYKNALVLAEKHHLETVAFSAISTGVYGYPLTEATKIAVSTIKNRLLDMKSIKEVIFVVFDDSLKEVYEKTFEHLGI